MLDPGLALPVEGYGNAVSYSSCLSFPLSKFLVSTAACVVHGVELLVGTKKLFILSGNRFTHPALSVEGYGMQWATAAHVSSHFRLQGFTIILPTCTVRSVLWLSCCHKTIIFLHRYIDPVHRFMSDSIFLVNAKEGAIDQWCHCYEFSESSDKWKKVASNSYDRFFLRVARELKSQDVLVTADRGTARFWSAFLFGHADEYSVRTKVKVSIDRLAFVEN